MKASIFAYLAAFHWQLNSATAKPVKEPTTTTTTTDVETYNHYQKRVLNINVDCNEIINTVLKGVNSYPQFASQVVAVGKKVGLPSATAWSVCKTFKQEVVNCNYAGVSIANGISLAIIHGFIDLNPTDEGVTSATKDNMEKREILFSHAEDYFTSRGLDFEDISIAPILDRRQDHGHFIEVRGVHEVGQDTTTDFHIYSRNDGSGHVRAIPSSTSPNHLERRTGGPGFKISWQVHSRSGSLEVQDTSKLAEVLRNDWKSRVESDHSIGDYIGVIDFTTHGYIQLRIIPETGGFGSNTERVDQCSV